MASPHLRYLALRSRLGPLAQHYATGEASEAVFAEQLTSELYRALAHLTAVAIYRAQPDALVRIVGRGPLEHPVLPLDGNVVASALQTEGVVYVPDRMHDQRALPTVHSFASEIAVALVPERGQRLVLDALIGEPRAPGLADRELFAWIAERVAAG